MSSKRLTRSKLDRKIFGVCGGLARYFGCDVVLFRLLFLCLLFTASCGFWIYILMALIVPVEEEGTIFEPEKHLYRSRSDRRILGVCGGIATYFNWDATVLRVIFAVGAVLTFGIAFICYLIAAIVMPKEP